MSKSIELKNLNMSVEDFHRSVQIGLSIKMAKELKLPLPNFNEMTIEQIENYKKSLEL